jgi:hypothetical protein
MYIVQLQLNIHALEETIKSQRADDFEIATTFIYVATLIRFCLSFYTHSLINGREVLSIFAVGSVPKRPGRP